MNTFPSDFTLSTLGGIARRELNRSAQALRAHIYESVLKGCTNVKGFNMKKGEVFVTIDLGEYEETIVLDVVKEIQHLNPYLDTRTFYLAGPPTHFLKVFIPISSEINPK